MSKFVNLTNMTVNINHIKIIDLIDESYRLIFSDKHTMLISKEDYELLKKSLPYDFNNLVETYMRMGYSFDEASAHAVSYMTRK